MHDNQTVTTLTKQKHTILPKTLKVQLITADNKALKLDNVLCHLNIYSDNGNYYTYSFIPTNSNGCVVLTREQIVNNTELKHFYNDTLLLDNNPVKFEFLVLDKTFISDFINSTKMYLTIDQDATLQELRSRGLAEEQIKKAAPYIEQKREEDRLFNEFLQKNKNQSLDYSSEKSKIVDHWVEEMDYSYELKMQQ